MSFEIEDIKRIRTKPGDVLVIRMPSELTSQDTADIINPVSELFQDTGVKLLFCHEGVDFEIITKEKLEGLNFEF